MRVEIEGLCMKVMRARTARDEMFAGAERALF
jgi:hypothetical protein